MCREYGQVGSAVFCHMKGSNYEPLSYSLPIVKIEVYRAGQTDVVGYSNTIILVEASTASEPRQPIRPASISYSAWLDFIKSDCEYNSLTEDVYMRDDQQPTARLKNTPNRLRYMLLKTQGPVCRFEIQSKNHPHPSQSNPTGLSSIRVTWPAMRRSSPELDSSKGRGKPPFTIPV
ncbi:hypothetical protein BO83DRAFT_391897 [Aspergillus eucalypticola CBS 122712]|uniref:Uncharacterized protein n=1 Tax=Aspergillus eucalypticola (strain CBS 122712 / IBT 29274) TaxID=1448314 RepID=A0A317UWK1_ASPEC|nr:uncharacterized protein BO83DRAFT_391897 [Aspergillus eucalypticola CBS 122712]PWY65789.1 hypothetical protein BO83DRAFT_391897 [Aspergillus eucalypticola CBS 122712]